VSEIERCEVKEGTKRLRGKVYSSRVWVLEGKVMIVGSRCFWRYEAVVLLNEFLVFVLEYEKSLRDSVVGTVHLLVCLLSLTPRALISSSIRSTTTRFVSNPFIGASGLSSPRT